jgi:hypothetical protein
MVIGFEDKSTIVGIDVHIVIAYIALLFLA